MNPFIPYIGIGLIIVAILVALFFGGYILRELLKRPAASPTSSLQSTVTTQPASAAKPMELRAAPTPATTDSKPEPADTAKLYRQAPFSPSERAFLDFLNETTNGQYFVQTKVQLRDLFARYGWLQKELYTMHSRGHVDFVLLDPKRKTPIVAIELDDKTHHLPKRQDADRRKEELFRRAGMKLLRFQVGKRWGDDERTVIREALPKQ